MPFAYITNEGSNNVSVIDTATDKVTATVNIGGYGVAATTYGKKVYVTDWVETAFRNRHRHKQGYSQYICRGAGISLWTCSWSN